MQRSTLKEIVLALDEFLLSKAMARVSTYTFVEEKFTVHAKLAAKIANAWRNTYDLRVPIDARVDAIAQHIGIKL